MVIGKRGETRAHNWRRTGMAWLVAGPLLAHTGHIAHAADATATTAPAAAEDEAASSVRWSGFGTLGAVHNDHSSAGAIYSSAQKKPANQGWSGNLDTVLGLQMDWQAAEHTSVVAQTVARAGEDGDVKLRMGYVRQQWGGDTALRLGRIRSPLFFDSDVNEIGYAYLSARAAMPVYNAINSVDHLDGVDLQWRHPLGDAALLVQAYYGSSDYQHRFYNLNPVQAADVSLTGVGGVALSMAWPSVTVRASYTQTDAYTMRSSQVSQLNSGLAQAAAGIAQFNGAVASASTQANRLRALQNLFDGKPTYASVGMDAYHGPWRFLAEVTELDTRSEISGRYLGYQMTVGRSVGNWTPYVAYARQMRQTPLLDTSSLVGTEGMSSTMDSSLATLKQNLDAAAQYADLSMSTWSVGVRWDVRTNVDVKWQWDRIETPSRNTPGYLALSALPFNNVVNLFSVTLDWIF